MNGKLLKVKIMTTIKLATLQYLDRLKKILNDTFQDNIVISIIKPNRDISNNNNDFEIQTIVKKLAINNNDFKLENISTIDINGHHSGKGYKV